MVSARQQSVRETIGSVALLLAAGALVELIFILGGWR
jgi:hypothetical protein